MKINHLDNQLNFTFNNTSLPLEHYHYDRFSSPDDPINGKWTLNFTTDPQGDISQVRVSLDEKEVIFTRKPESEIELKKLVGKYDLNGQSINLIIKGTELVVDTSPQQHLEPYKGNIFKIREFSDQTVEFVFNEAGDVKGFKVTYDGKTIMVTRK